MTELIVQTENGLLRGAVNQSIEGFDYCAFKGIPYAKPPVGDLRFRDPLPAENWEDIRDATNYQNICGQYDAMLRIYDGSDDCLYLNVFTRSIDNENGLKPVMFWIHGGGFMFGSGNDTQFGPDYLMRKDIVLVTINYRLGVLGFLNLEDEVAPGNQGLKDQIMALQWVQANIKNFGGDPNNVTVFGESVGASCVHYLCLIPTAKDLFHKGICQSCGLFGVYSYVKEPRNYVYKLCSFLGNHSRDSNEIVHFLRTIDIKKLVQAQEKVRRSGERMNFLFPFGPGMDSKSPNPLVPVPVEELALNGIQIPVMLGYNDREGICFLIGLAKERFEYIDQNFDTILHPRGMDILKKYGLTTKDLKRLYFNNDKIYQANCGKFADLMGELYFIEGIHRTVKVQMEKSSFPTYAYKFSFADEVTLMKSLLQFPVAGAAHFDEVEYLFYVNQRRQIGFKALRKGTRGHKVMQQMVEMWTNFATCGSPTPTTTDLLPVKWQPVDDGTNILLLNIGKELRMEMVTNLEEYYSAAKSTRH